MEPDVISESDYERLRRAAGTPRTGLVLRLAAEVGLRPAEMTRLRLADLECLGDHQFLTVRDGDGTTREVPLPDDVTDEIRAYARSTDRDGDDPLFDVSPRRLQMLVRDATERADGLADVSSRDLRWFFAERLLSAGVPVHVVRELGGWRRLDRLEPLLEAPDRDAVLAALSGADHPTRLRRTIAAAADVGERVTDAATVAEIERAVCRRLADTDGFRFAWLAERTGDELTRRTTAGVGTDRAESQLSTHAPDILAALDAREVGVVDGRDGPLALVPLVDETTAPGVLSLGTSGPVVGAERELLSALGAQVGHALAAVERKRLLLADTVTELTFQCTDEAAVTVGLSATLDCTVDLSGVVPVGGRSLLYYLVVDGAATEDALAYVADDGAVEDTRLIEDYGDGALLEVVVTAAPTLSLVERGGRIRALTADGGTASLTAEFPSETDVRPAVDAVVDAYPGTTLTAKHEAERPAESEMGFRDRLSEPLSDRQETVLRAAYHSGYFEWPRGSTAEELADSLDVSSPTLHNHLRRAQQKLLTAFFDETPSGDRPRWDS